ncbi:hypothetical protein [Streptomyces sp. NPDC087297]|uniref:hypothetical protein n=1 Tax=Streptomyces sp. NPDC087297 TaxID=3365778 RepID=UPI00382D6B73
MHTARLRTTLLHNRFFQRPLALLALCASGLALVLVTGTLAHAHGDGVSVVVTGQQAGHVTADITWENDADPIEEPVAGTVNANTPDGARSLGPWRLIRTPGKPEEWTTAETLPAGQWSITVDVGFPSLGHDTALVNVPESETPPASQVTAAPVADATETPVNVAPVVPTPAAGSAAPRHAGSGMEMWWTAAALAITLAGVTALTMIRRTPPRGWRKRG